MTKTTVELARVSRSYSQVCAVRDVSFSLAEGEIVALVGHNGAGKTTLIKMMLGLIRPTSGTVRVLGADPAEAPDMRARMSYLPENVSFNPSLTGRETLHFYAALKRVGRDETEIMLERIGLRETAGRRVGTYSKGMRQRLGVAQALLGEPKVLLLDEPTTGLDPILRHDFYGFLNELRGRGATVLLSSHALSELEGRADHVLIMGQGEKKADGTLDELRRIARLPTRIRVRVADGMKREGEMKGWRRINGSAIEIDAAPEEKIALIRSVVGEVIDDLDITPPTLDELYAHFQGSQEQGR